MACTVEQRAAARSVVDAALAYDGVVAAYALAPSEGPRPTWSLEIVCEEPMPVPLHELLAEAGFGVAHAAPRGDHLHVVAV